MGWWTQDRQGASFADEGDGIERIWGDEPADLIDGALDGIVKAFTITWDRPPTLEELRAGFEFSLARFKEPRAARPVT